MSVRLLPVVTVVALLAAGCGGGDGGDATGESDLSYLREFVGRSPAESGLLESEPLHERLDTLLGPRYETLVRCMEEAGPVFERGGVLLAVGKFTHRDGATGAVLLVDTAGDTVNVRFKVNRIVQEFHEGGRNLDTPPELDALFAEVEATFYGTAPEPEPAATPSRDRAEPASGSETPAAPPLPPAGHVYRGFLVVGPDLATFMVCETFETAWVRNESGSDLLEIHRSLGAKEYAPVYSEIRGGYEPAPPEIVRDGFDVLFTLTELRRAYPGSEGPDCSENLAFVFRAFGNEPFWSVKISGTGIAVTRPDDAEPPWFPHVEPMLEPGATRYISRKGERTIDVVVRAGRCRDTMSGAYFNLSAEMQLDGRTYTGCAVRGTE